MKKQILFFIFLFLLTNVANAQNEFITVWETTSNSESITIPVSSSGGSTNYNVDWGDGTTSSGLTGNTTHVYALAGFYSVKISGSFPGIFFTNNTNKLKIKSIEQWGNIVWKSMAYSYNGCSNLVINASDTPFLGNVTSLLAMFQSCTSLGTGTSTSWNNWDVTTITNMSSMFGLATNFNKAIGNWVVENVTDMSNMFTGVTNFNQSLLNWDTSKVTEMSSMFDGATSFNQSLEFWDVSKVTNMSYLFKGATAFDGNITGWNTASVTDMSFMFNNAQKFNQAIGSWKTANVTDMSNMFSGAILFNQPLTSNGLQWNVSKVTDMRFMFSEATQFNGNITNWNTSKVTDMRAMFRNATSFDQDLSNWNFGLVTDLTAMFLNGTLSTTNYDALLTSFANQTTQNNLLFDGGNSIYCASAADRQKLLNAPKNWTITDGGIQTTTWTGAVDSDWANSGNWSNCVPTTEHLISIPSGTPNNPLIKGTTVAHVKNLTILSGATVTIVDKASLSVEGNLTVNAGGQLNAYSNTGVTSILCKGTAAGTINYYVHFTPSKWFLITTPLIGQDIYNFVSNAANDILTSASNNYSLALYDNNASGAGTSWNYYNTTNLTASGTLFEKGKGYSMQRGSGGSLYSNFSGTLLNGDALIPVSQGSYNNWNLIGNPYLSFLDVSSFITTNVSLFKPTHQALYVWDNAANSGSGGYVPIVGSNYIPTAMGFFVNVQANGNYSFTKAMQSHQISNSYFRTTDTDFKITLVLSKQNQQRTTEINFNENATNGLDPGLDLGAFGGNSTDFSINTQLVENNQGVDFMIQSLPDNNYENVEIPINVKATANTEIDFKATINNLPSTIFVYLEDRALQTVTRLDNQDDYKVLLDTDINGLGRFYMRLSTQETLGVNDPLEVLNISVYQKNKTQLVVDGLPEGLATIAIFDVLGKKVLQSLFKENKQHVLNLNSLTRGVYIVKVTTKKGSFQKKILM